MFTCGQLGLHVEIRFTCGQLGLHVDSYVYMWTVRFTCGN